VERWHLGKLTVVAVLGLACAVLPACRIGGERSVSAENDRLRQLSKDQQTQIASLEGEISELKAKLNEASLPNQGLAPEALEAMPRVTQIEISSLSGFMPTEGTTADKVIVWFETRDGRSRFVQAVGTVNVEALTLAPKLGDSSPASERIGAATLTPVQLRDAYRSSFTGTHYAVEIPLDKPIDRTGKSLVMRVELHDAVTGQVVKGERVISPTSSLPTTSSRRE
jgi:hypothetical protein